MKEEKVCHLISKTPTESDLIPTWAHFDCLNTFVDESHLFRFLLKCKECGQLYFFEFYEVIDWDNGDDSQYNKYIPVKTIEEANEINSKSQFELLVIHPRLQQNLGKGNTGEVRWIR